MPDNQVKAAVSRRPRNRKGEKKNDVSKVLLLSCILAATIFCMAAAFKLPAAFTSVGSAPAKEEPEGRKGKIVLQADGKCQQMEFDNSTGRLTEESTPCGDAITFDSHHIPVPTATIRRLDAISRSFSSGH